MYEKQDKTKQNKSRFAIGGDWAHLQWSLPTISNWSEWVRKFQILVGSNEQYISFQQKSSRFFCLEKSIPKGGLKKNRF
jgi:hypothetical protein